MVEQLHEVEVLLSEHLLQADCDIGNLAEGTAPEEIGGGIMVAQNLLVARCDHRGELLEVSDHQQLHTPEGPGVAAVFPQGVVDGVKQVGPDHRDFIDYQQVD